MKVLKFFPVLLLAASAYGQTPTITSIQNPASNILTGLPNFGIAQGQIFVLYGTNMGPTTLVQPTALPWPNTLSGTSVKITQTGTVYNAPIIYTLNTQIAAIMPSNVPLGLGATVQVTYNGTPGNTFTTRVVDSNFGISTVDTTGTGTAVLTDGNYNVITTTNSAKPGSTYAMWGTGLGAANSDNNIATNGDLGTNIQVFVGGVQAIVTYRGRSGAPGLDQINFTIPQGVSGCYVSLVVQTNTSPVRVSNGPTIPISANGGTCSDVNGLPLSTINAALAQKGNFVFSGLALQGNKSNAIGFFLRFTPAQIPGLVAQLLTTLSPGSCATSISAANSSGGSDGAPPSTGLDAGPALTLTQPTGNAVSLALAQTGVYQGSLTAVTPGSYKLSNGTGGAGVGPFTVSFNGPQAFAWTNSTISTVTRANGLKITWTGGDANSIVDISGGAAGNPVTLPNGTVVNSNSVVQFDCQAPAAAGSFTIPATVLLAMPAVTGAIQNGNISVQLNVNPQTIAIPGADVSYAVVNTPQFMTNVSFQ